MRNSDETETNDLSSLSRPLGGWHKRGFDIVVATSALLILLPLFGVLSLIIVLTDGAPIFYGQKRRGYGGAHFTCWKFRTMVRDADMALDTYLASDREAAVEWSQSRKLKSDPRVTAIGSFLRKTSLDELPQLWNVLVGEMSVVGPRPVVDGEIGYYGGAFKHYAAARPGITGAWQVSGRSDTSYPSRVRLDSEYVTQWSLGRDIVILSRTIPAVLSQRGSY